MESSLHILKYAVVGLITFFPLVLLLLAPLQSSSRETAAPPKDALALLTEVSQRYFPLGVLIDAQGKVVFYESGYEISELRGAIANLGPEFAALATAKVEAK